MGRTIRALALVAGAWACLPLAAQAETHPHGPGRAITHAPIGVMGDHRHGAGEWMLSYRYGFMSMTGNRDGSERRSTSDVLDEYMVAPRAMDMEMHMFGVMYAPTDWVTLAVMVPYVRLDMDHENRMGVSFTTRSHGIGDVAVSGIFKLWKGERNELLANFGVSAPSGTIHAKDNLPNTMGEPVRLPYPMQLGSGTPDLLPGLTWNGDFGRFRLGSQLRGVYRIGRNDLGYRLGHRVMATSWAAVELCPSLSASLRLAFERWRDVVGDDDDLNPAMVPTADPELRAGRRLDVSLGLNYLVRSGPLAGNRFAIEASRPVHQSLHGPQLETDWTATAGWQLAF